MKHLSPALSYMCQISWYSLTGYAAFYLQKSCIGNELNSTTKKIIAYIPRIFLAFPILLATSAVDFGANISSLGLLAFYSFSRNYYKYEWEQLQCDFISLIALPIILSGSLFYGKIPQSTRPGSSFFASYTVKDWDTCMTTNPLDVDKMAKIAMESASEGMSYTLARMLDSVDESTRKELLLKPCQIYPEYSFGKPCPQTLRGSVLLGAVYSTNLDCVEIAIRAGANLKIENEKNEVLSKEMRLNLLFYSCSGPIEILERIIALESFDPNETFSISFEQLKEWFTHLNELPPDTNLDDLQNISIVELSLLAGNTKALKLFQDAGAKIDYFQLAQFKYFLENPKTNPKICLSTQCVKKNNDWVFETTILENPAPYKELSYSTTSRLKDNKYYRLWTQIELFRELQRGTVTNLANRQTNKMTPVHVNGIQEVLETRKKIAAFISPVLNDDLANIVTFY